MLSEENKGNKLLFVPTNP